MAKLLKGLIVMLLAVSVVALVLSFKLFQKREELKGRTQILEGVMAALAATFEAEEPVVEDPPAYPERDIGEVTDKPNDHPDRAGFWSGFRHELELAAAGTMNLAKHRYQLMQYYRMDPITLKPVRDPHSGRKLTTGTGTMRKLLNGVIVKAEEQLARLNLTRLQLRTTRKELVTSIAAVNNRKQELRGALATITTRDSTVGHLRDEVVVRDDRIDEYVAQVSDLNDTVHARDLTVSEQQEAIYDLKEEVEQLDQRIRILIGKDPKKLSIRVWDSLSRGLKGEVLRVHPEWNFVILKLNGDFVAQYAAALQKDPSIPQPELVLSRDLDARKSFVTKVRLKHVDPARCVGVADILTDWLQASVQEGDIAVY
jgi:hypothetical protein